MRLELGTFQVRAITFGRRTAYQHGVLTIDREDLLSQIADPRFRRADVRLARPGEDVRIVHVLDTVEPRVKVEGPGCVFPGFLGPPLTVGSGRTYRLAGVAVVETGLYRAEGAGVLSQLEAVVDMNGPGAPYSPFSSTQNVVLSFEAAEGVSDVEYDAAMRMASLRMAAFLAETVRDQTPDRLDVFELARPAERLPRIGYLYTVHSIGTLSETYLYGEDVRRLVPTLIHPNEPMDGALVSLASHVACVRNITYVHQNNPVIRELYRRHGVDLDFAGVVLLRGHYPSDSAKERNASYAAKVAGLLGCEAVIVNPGTAGNSVMDLMMAAQQCERVGIKAVVITYEQGAADGRDQPLVFSVPEADAIVSTGNREEVITLPAMPTVIGGDRLLDLDYAAKESFSTTLWRIYASTNQHGIHTLAAAQH